MRRCGRRGEGCREDDDPEGLGSKEIYYREENDEEEGREGEEWKGEGRKEVEEA